MKKPVSVDYELCRSCGMPWHPPALCYAYRSLDVNTIETIAARIFNFFFDEPDISTWEGEGGR
jgi:hypothetical protein